MTEQILIELWKKSRDTAKHFDKLLADTRKMTLTFVFDEFCKSR